MHLSQPEILSFLNGVYVFSLSPLHVVSCLAPFLVLALFFRLLSCFRSKATCQRPRFVRKKRFLRQAFSSLRLFWRKHFLPRPVSRPELSIRFQLPKSRVTFSFDFGKMSGLDFFFSLKPRKVFFVWFSLFVCGRADVERREGWRGATPPGFEPDFSFLFSCKHVCFGMGKIDP